MRKRWWDKDEKNVSNVFRPHYTLEKIKSAIITGHFAFEFEQKLGEGNHVIIVTLSFSKSSVFNMFSVHTKTKSWRFRSPSLKSGLKNIVLAAD